MGDWDAPGSWSSSDKVVCWRCVTGDDYLIETLREAGEANSDCSYCGKSGAASLDLLLELVARASEGWQDAEDVMLPYVSAEGGYIFPTRDLWDAQQDLLQDYVGDGDLLNDILSAFTPKVVSDLDWGEDDENPQGWGWFSEHVRQEARYMFWVEPSGHAHEEGEWGGANPMRVLEDIARTAQARGLVRHLEADVGLWRARGHVGSVLEGGATASRLGTVPAHLAFSPNRMSAPGIPMFYGALDRATAVTEATRHGDPKWTHVTAARFFPTRPLVVLDLCDVEVPGVPSVFRAWDDPVVVAYRDAVFLDAFVKDVRQPVSDDDAHRSVEYVPTQVFTEFVIHAMGQLAEPSLRFDGVAYPSAELEGGANIVLNVRNERCLAAPSRYAERCGSLELVLDAASIETGRRQWVFE